MLEKLTAKPIPIKLKMPRFPIRPTITRSQLHILLPSLIHRHHISNNIHSSNISNSSSRYSKYTSTNTSTSCSNTSCSSSSSHSHSHHHHHHSSSSTSSQPLAITPNALLLAHHPQKNNPHRSIRPLIIVLPRRILHNFPVDHPNPPHPSHRETESCCHLPPIQP